MWVHRCDPETQHQNSQWKNGSSPCPKKVKKSNHTSKAQWWSYMRALLITNLFLQTKQFTSITSRRFYNVWDRKSAEIVENIGRTRIGWYTLPAHSALSVQQFLAAKNMPVVPTLFTCPIWPLVNYSCFHESNHNYKGIISIPSLKFKNTCQPPHIQFHKVASKSGRNTRTIA